jgi:chromate transporter
LETKKGGVTPLELFWIFFKIGAFTFGGGYAMIPLIEKEVSENRKWVTSEEVLDIVAISESTPGPISINTATFIGYKLSGQLGAFCATLGVVLPSFLCILAVSYVLRQFESAQTVKYAFFGIRAGVLALILRALWTMFRQCPKGTLSYVLMAAAFATVAIFDFNVLLVIVGCAAVGLAAALLASRKEGQA